MELVRCGNDAGGRRPDYDYRLRGRHDVPRRLTKGFPGQHSLTGSRHRWLPAGGGGGRRLCARDLIRDLVVLGDHGGLGAEPRRSEAVPSFCFHLLSSVDRPPTRRGGQGIPQPMETRGASANNGSMTAAIHANRRPTLVFDFRLASYAGSACHGQECSCPGQERVKK